MTLDSHQHFWKYDQAQYPWIPKGTPLHRDWLPADLGKELAAAGMDRSIAVQARQTFEESQWLLELARDPESRIAGVVGWVDLRSPAVEADLAALAADPKFRGVRHVVQDEPDDGFMLQPDFLRGIRALRAHDLAYDILVQARQLPAAIEMARHFPEQPFVLDHIAKPLIKAGVLAPWQEQIRELARQENICCKVSGLITEANQAAWKAADFTPFLDTVFECFGPQRLMFGSDWPVCLLAGSYSRVIELVRDYTAKLSEAERAGIFGGNAARFYKVDRIA